MFATGLVAGGALAGVIVALISIPEKIYKALSAISMEHKLTEMLGDQGYQILGVVFFTAMGLTLYRVGTKKMPGLHVEATVEETIK